MGNWLGSWAARWRVPLGFAWGIAYLVFSQPTGRLLVHMIAALAEFERELIRERVRAGIARVKATGKTRSGQPVGRPRRLVDVQAALALRSQGKSWREVEAHEDKPEVPDKG